MRVLDLIVELSALSIEGKESYLRNLNEEDSKLLLSHCIKNQSPVFDYWSKILHEERAKKREEKIETIINYKKQ
jgi:hypothetical protein